ncbi:hypothetical protein [Salibacterium halotolerans]|uniref:Uncharacterized protein n=1 Tax=Salibacterium halotolerans TaxID=1884432 RepID=A0A1I5S0U9_9BACI|nr:hypothetical protein [Salibacterium halotolerans]SFP64369.1 hypothetical protein SAMN05518683_1086 [Salibacterium halotolerans]
MQRVIELIFGKPDKSSTVSHISYWMFIAGYIAILIIAVLSPVHWVAVLSGAVLFPAFFRLVNKLNRLIRQHINMKVFFITASVFTFLLAIGVTAILYFYADNVTVNASKRMTNGAVTVSIGTLRGNYNVTEVGTTERGGTLFIPYTASVGEGTITLSAETEDQVLWEQEISDSRDGTMQIQGFITDGSFDIQVAAEEASDVSVELRNP